MAYAKGKRDWRYKHGLSRHPLYACFASAKLRCTNTNCRGYKTYKGRWGKNTIAELTQYYLKEYELFVRNNPGITPSIDRVNEGDKYEIGNIQIISHGENTKKYLKIKGHPHRGKFGEKHHNSKPVEAFIDGEWVRFAGAAEAERETGTNNSNILQVCLHRRTLRGYLRKTAGGYRWRFA